jgi:hypothetical protein
MRRQQVPAPEIEHRAMPRLAVLTKGFDDPHILVRHAFAAGGTDHPQEHGLPQKLSLRESNPVGQPPAGFALPRAISHLQKAQFCAAK